VLGYLTTAEHQMWRARYWRRRSDCYSGLFTTSLVVTTISVYNVLWPSVVASLSGPGSSALVLCSPVIWSSLICLWSLPWSASLILSLAAFICLPLWSGLVSYLLQSDGLDLLEGFRFPC
jgi:hypothetical protein